MAKLTNSPNALMAHIIVKLMIKSPNGSNGQIAKPPQIQIAKWNEWPKGKMAKWHNSPNGKMNKRLQLTNGQIGQMAKWPKMTK